MSTRIVLPLSCIEGAMAIIIRRRGHTFCTPGTTWLYRLPRIPTIAINKELIMPKTTPEEINALVRSYPEKPVRKRNTLKRDSTRFAAALLAALASFVADPNAALAAAPQHHDQAPGFYRLKVGDFEVTALFDGTAAFDPHWLNGTKATMDSVAKALHEDPHMLDVADTGFLVNTGTQLILVDAGAGTWWGGAALGRLAGNLRRAGYTPEEVKVVLITHLHSHHLTPPPPQDRRPPFPTAHVS